MRLRSAIFLLAVLGLLGGGTYVALFQRDWWMPYFKKGRHTALGFTPAQSPQEAIDKFRQAMKGREYEAAALYCTGEYAAELRRAASAGEAMGEALDNLQAQMDKSGVQASDRAKVVLLLLEPFPRQTRVVKLDEQGEDKAQVTIEEDYGTLRPVDLGSERWAVNLLFYHALAGGPTGNLALGQPMEIEIIREDAEDDDEAWKLNLPVTADDRRRIDELINKYNFHVKALDRIREDMRVDAVTRFNLESRLRSELESAK
jgi:hypothetical protein